MAGTADGTEVLRVPIPAELLRLDARKRQLQRRNRNKQAPRKGVAPSNRWREAQERINKLDHRMAAIREDVLHKATTELTQSFDVVVVEDLNVAGMVTRGGAYKKGLNRAIARAGMSQSRTMLGYKSTELVLADRWFPSSKTCSACGAVRSKLGLDEREYVCEHAACGHTMDRDLNAAVNLAKYGERLMDNAGNPPVSGRGAERKTSASSGAGAAGCEAPSLRSGQGTVVTPSRSLVRGDVTSRGRRSKPLVT
ncbi:RNA-guided endonuclease InsQ/TnpB family protein [Mycobacteroides abscessus]|uniref:RNA-guided endonuclease InsQ/TnpB family protein n=1 Tax=Mycobacteroides abscessus TaxID=36809 RepID=UPI00092C323C|nr:RNA-guided endonuclease TnpB family protein [Mycobacteroides abscessus]SIF35009.1 putative transposase [Mycobacteroides abscessus subsp. abscessus]